MKYLKKIFQTISNYINKNDIITMAFIIAMSVIIAILYNSIRSDNCSGRLPFFKTNVEKRAVSDDDLFGNTAEPINKNIPQENKVIEPIIDTITTPDTTIIDTIATTKVDTSDNETLLKETKKSNTEDHPIITKKQMQKILEDTTGNFIIVDARRTEDYKEAHIGNAINIFPYVDDENVVIDKVFALPKNKTIIVYCDGGNCDSSHKVGDILKMFGYKFFIFEGGWEEWTK